MLKVNAVPDLLSIDIIDEIKAIPTSLLSDVMSGFGVMNYRIKPITPGMKVTGTAFTVNLKAGNALAVIAAAAMASQGYVLVIDGKGDMCNAVFGDLLARTAIRSGCEGVVLDGLVRDIAQLRRMGLPVFCIGAVPTAPEKEEPGEINGPLSCGGVVVNPGDLVIGDDDGVIVVPRDRIKQTIEAAKLKELNEMKRIKDIENGLLMPQWLRKRVNHFDNYEPTEDI